MSTQEHHYFASTAYCWVTSDTIDDALRKLRQETNRLMSKKKISGIHYILTRVPLPQTAHYDISQYIPQVDGTELIEHGKFK